MSTTLTIPRHTRPNAPTLARAIAEHVGVALAWTHRPLRPVMDIDLGETTPDAAREAARTYLDAHGIRWEVQVR